VLLKARIKDTEDSKVHSSPELQSSNQQECHFAKSKDSHPLAMTT